MFNSPIPRSGLKNHHESSGQRSPRDSDNTSKLWIKGQGVKKQVARNSQAIEQAQRQLNRLRRQRLLEPVQANLYPFKLMQSPAMDAVSRATYTPPETEGADLSLRAFRVRAGALGTTPVAGTDGADVNPVSSSVNPNPDYDVDVDFVVPEDTALFYVWVDATNDAAPFIDQGTTIPGGGTDDDWWGGIYYLIAVIDTTKELGSDEVVRQYIRDDLPRCLA